MKKKYPIKKLYFVLLFLDNFNFVLFLQIFGFSYDFFKDFFFRFSDFFCGRGAGDKKKSY